MVVIRLSRAGTKKVPFYHVVIADQRKPRDGRFIERVGYYDAVARGNAKKIELNKERIQYWISKGAQPSERVNHVIKEFDYFVANGAYPVKKPRKKVAKKAEEQAA
ncbi:MAG: 30S ribosomal protein S16 [Proteobacteria bacterium]|nr:30S ribosomal protein S16 [Pseudomonadota bacterium]